MAIDEYQLGQKSGSVDILHVVAQQLQLRQNLVVPFAVSRIKGGGKTFHQLFLFPETDPGAFDKPVKRRHQPLPRSFLQVHPQHFDLSVDEFMANILHGLA